MYYIYCYFVLSHHHHHSCFSLRGGSNSMPLSYGCYDAESSRSLVPTHLMPCYWKWSWSCTHTHNTHTWCCPTENSLCRCTYTWRFAIERTLAHVPDAVLLKIHVHLYAYCTLRYWKFTCSQCIDRYWRALKFLRASILVTFQFDLKQDEQKGTVFWNIHVPRNLAAFHTPHTQ